MRIHQDWSTPAFDLPPVAEAVGPFPLASFLRTVTEFSGETVEIVEDGDGLWVLSRTDDQVTFAGHPDLTDYHTPLGAGADPVLSEYVAQLGPDIEIVLDSMPVEAAESAAKGLEAAGVETTTSQHTVAAVLSLPDDFETYLVGIGKKQRHEVRRKRRRYEEELGDLILERHTGLGWGFDEFVRLHRLADGAKGEFMTGSRLELFEALVSSSGWVVDLLRHPHEDRATASAFAHVGEDYSLYNSSYDPGLSAASPGVALVGAIIERAIDDRCRHFDFLKGDEVYKIRLGAKERPLYLVSGRT